MRGFQFIFMIVFLIAACSENTKIIHFKTVEKALDNFSEDQNIKGNIEVLKTINNEKFIVAKSIGNSYFVGELIETNKGFYAVRISDNVQLEMGGSWPLITIDGNKYTIIFEKKNKHGFLQLFNREYFVSIVKEHEKGNIEILTNAIEVIEVNK